MRCLPVSLLLLLSVACADPATPPAVADPRSLAARAPAAIPGAADLLQPGAVVVIGEMHGTEEFPALVLDLARLASSGGKAVSVHLEIPNSEQARLDAIVAGTASREAPRDGIWAAEYQDGRRSRAMWELLLGLGDTARATRRVRVTCMDPGNTPGATGFDQLRDRGMAHAVAADVRARPGDVHLVLVGNIHSRTEAGLPWEPAAAYEPFARLLRSGGVTVTPLLGRYTGGTYWACTSNEASSCGPQKADAQAGTKAARELHVEAGVEGGYAGVAMVGELHASPPARSTTSTAGRPVVR